MTDGLIIIQLLNYIYALALVHLFLSKISLKSATMGMRYGNSLVTVFLYRYLLIIYSENITVRARMDHPLSIPI